MPKGERKHYSKEFKLSAVYLMLSKTMQPKEIFQMLDVDRQTVYRWVSEFKAQGEAACDLGLVEAQAVEPENLKVIGHVGDLLVDIYAAIATHTYALA